MRFWLSGWRALLLSAFSVMAAGMFAAPSLAQETVSAAAVPAPSAVQDVPTPLTEEELEILVARIALYPDELVAVISEASLYPLQIVEAARFLEKAAKDKSLKPKDTWDGSVISLLNYPQVVTMMSDDLEWTQTFGDALTYQQKDVLVAIQQLRDKAVADGVIKTDDKVTVTTQNDNVVIQSANPETIYIPQYEPEMLYAPGYPIAPISYYPDPYPNYYYPTAPYFAAFVTGAIWGAAMDWDNWGVWGGGWNGNDLDIDCNNCFNNINGKINFNDVDWKNVDRSKINFDKNQFAKIDRTNINNRIKADDRNNFRNKAADVKRPTTLPAKNGPIKDVRKTQIEQGLKNKPGAVGGNQGVRKPANAGANRPAAKPAKVDRPVGKPRPAVKTDNRPKKPSGLGNVSSGKRQNVASNRGQKSMGGGMRGGGGGGHKSVNRGGGGRQGGGGGGRRR